jgi:diacylglycerol kinase (ATP)
MADVAVVAHSRKSFGGGLPELREILAREGVTDPLWYEVKKSRRAPKCARRAAAKGADVMFVWGGDGTVQRCIDAVAGTETAVAILPAGTSNLLAKNLRVPHDLAEAVQIGLHEDDRGSGRLRLLQGQGFVRAGGERRQDTRRQRMQGVTGADEELDRLRDGGRG